MSSDFLEGDRICTRQARALGCACTRTFYGSSVEGQPSAAATASAAGLDLKTYAPPFSWSVLAAESAYLVVCVWRVCRVAPRTL